MSRSCGSWVLRCLQSFAWGKGKKADGSEQEWRPARGQCIRSANKTCAVPGCLALGRALTGGGNVKGRR